MWDQTFHDIPNGAITNLFHPHELKPSERPIYVASISVLLYDVFQINTSRGRLCFQVGEDDTDMTTSDIHKLQEYIFAR